MNNMYIWVSGFSFSIRNIISIGLSVVCWSIWKSTEFTLFSEQKSW